MRIKELHLLTDNITETESFYNTVLEVKTEQKTSTSVSFNVGNTRIIFVQTKADTNPVYHFALDIPNNKFEEAFEWIKKRTQLIPVLEENNFVSNFDLWNAKSLYFYDNNKNLLELICRFDVDNATNDSFDSSSILYASEIGIVSESASKTAKKLTDKYGITEYTKQTGTDSFTALGDDYGLLVLVNNQRNWFPTTDLAKAFPSKIVFDYRGKENYILETESLGENILEY